MKISFILIFSALLFFCTNALADNGTPSLNDKPAPDYETLAQRSSELDPIKNPEEVITLLEPYKDNAGNSSVCFFNNLGLAYKNVNRFKDAIDAYQHSLRIQPDIPETQYNLAIAYAKNMELSMALRNFLQSAGTRPEHLGTRRWIDYLIKKLNVFQVPDINGMKLILDKQISINKVNTDRESRLRVYKTEAGGRVQVLSVNDSIFSYGIDGDMTPPVDYIIIDSDGDGDFEKIINSKNRFEIPSWAYNPEKKKKRKRIKGTHIKNTEDKTVDLFD